MEYYPQLKNLGSIYTVDMIPDEYNEQTYNGEQDILDLIK